jgi:hypothetical protein
MGWYLRKSFGFGPLRLNLSKSGLGYSLGVRGARLGVGPRGTYVHLGRGGVYYRKYLNSSSGTHGPSTPYPPSPEPLLPQVVSPIETADVSALVDSSAAELLQEITEKNGKIRVAPLIAALSIVAIVGLLLLRVPLWACSIVSFLFAALHRLCQTSDFERKRTELRYNFDKDATHDYVGLLGAFSWLANAHSIWRLTGTNMDFDPKYNAGASKLIDRKRATVGLAAPAGVDTNMAIWRLHTGEQALYFLPDRVLIEQSGSFGAVEYSDFVIQDATVRFIEDSGVPGDTQLVDRTWRFTNKGGGPDRRFANNPEIPIVLYGEVHLKSTSGVHIALQVSNPKKAENFANGLREFLRGHQGTRPVLVS